MLEDELEDLGVDPEAPALEDDGLDFGEGGEVI